MSAAQIRPFKGAATYGHSPRREEIGTNIPPVSPHAKSTNKNTDTSPAESPIRSPRGLDPVSLKPGLEVDKHPEEQGTGEFINYDYEGEPEPEEYWEESEETHGEDREAMASQEQMRRLMEYDPDELAEPTIKQSDTESYKGMCSAEFRELMVEVDKGYEEGTAQEDDNEGNSRLAGERIEVVPSPNEEEVGENEGIEEKGGVGNIEVLGDFEGIEEEQGIGINDAVYNEAIGEAEEEEGEEGEGMEIGGEEGPQSLKGPRRSPRISKRGPARSYATPRKRTRKKMPKLVKGACSRAIEGEAELRQALNDEFLKDNPLNANQVMQADLYCGIQQSAVGMGAEGPTQEGANVEEESVLGGINFDSDDELTDYEGAGASASK